MNYQINSATHIGNRDENQDALIVVQQHNRVLLMVADGLGGHEKGHVAAENFCRIFAAHFETATQPQLETIDGLKALFAEALAELQAFLDAHYPTTDTQTTCAIAVLTPKGWGSLHVGDSRVYFFSHQGAAHRTRDHSVTQLLLDEGEITESEMGTHPDQGRLIKSIARAEVTPSVKLYAPLEPGDSLLLCSDGFWEQWQVTELLQALGKSPSVDLNRMVATAVERAKGKSDNVTVILLHRPSASIWQRVKAMLFSS